MQGHSGDNINSAVVSFEERLSSSLRLQFVMYVLCRGLLY